MDLAKTTTGLCIREIPQEEVEITSCYDATDPPHPPSEDSDVVQDNVEADDSHSAFAYAGKSPWIVRQLTVRDEASEWSEDELEDPAQETPALAGEVSLERVFFGYTHEQRLKICSAYASFCRALIKARDPSSGRTSKRSRQ